MLLNSGVFLKNRELFKFQGFEDVSLSMQMEHSNFLPSLNAQLSTKTGLNDELDLNLSSNCDVLKNNIFCFQ